MRRCESVGVVPAVLDKAAAQNSKRATGEFTAGHTVDWSSRHRDCCAGSEAVSTVWPRELCESCTEPPGARREKCHVARISVKVVNVRGQVLAIANARSGVVSEAIALSCWRAGLRMLMVCPRAEVEAAHVKRKRAAESGCSGRRVQTVSTADAADLAPNPVGRSEYFLASSIWFETYLFLRISSDSDGRVHFGKIPDRTAALCLDLFGLGSGSPG